MPCWGYGSPAETHRARQKRSAARRGGGPRTDRCGRGGGASSAGERPAQPHAVGRDWGRGQGLAWAKRIEGQACLPLGAPQNLPLSPIRLQAPPASHPCSCPLLCSAKILSSSLWTLHLPTTIIGRNDHPAQREALAMTHLLRWIRHLGQLSCTLLTLLGDGVCYFMLRLRTPHHALVIVQPATLIRWHHLMPVRSRARPSPWMGIRR